MKQDRLYSVDELREMEGLSRQVHDTLEDITRRIQPITYEPVIKEPIELGFMPEGYPLD